LLVPVLVMAAGQLAAASPGSRSRRGRAGSRRHRADPANWIVRAKMEAITAASRWCSRPSSPPWRLPRRTMR